jgi:flagellar motor switch protein FliM
LRELAVPTNFNIMAIRPLRGSGLIVCEPTLIFGVIDTLYGGIGKFQTRIEGRDFSATEQRVINRLVDVITDEYKKAWKGVYPLELEYQRSEMQPQFANIATPSEIVVATSFSLEIGEISGSIHICMPYATLEPIRDVLYSSTQGDSMEVDKRWVNVLTQEIQSAEVRLVAELAKSDATVEQLIAMKPGDFIELERKPRIKAMVSKRVNGQLKNVQLAYNGLAPSPCRAPRLEAVLEGQVPAAVTAAALDAAIAASFTARDGLRATWAYRALVARNLVLQFIEDNQTVEA